MKIYGPLAKAMRRCMRLGLRGWRITGTLPQEPSVFLVHHQNLYGPLHAIPVLPQEVRLWALHVFCSRNSCFSQYYGYTFTKRFGWPKVPAFLTAGFLSWVLPRVLGSLGVIPVYRGSKKIRKTMELSLEALEKGESLLICPDRDYAGEEDQTGEIYRGFFQLERSYFRKTGKHLPFVPLRCDKDQKILRIGRPLCFQNGRKFREERAAVERALRESMNA